MVILERAQSRSQSECGLLEILCQVIDKLVPPTRVERATRGLGNRSHSPIQAYWNSLRPTQIKVCEIFEFWLE